MSRGTLRAVILIPSRYDDKGVMVFRFGLVPNGTAGFIAGLCEDYNRRHPDGTKVEWRIFDEHVETSVTPELLRRWTSEASGSRLLLLLAGTQTNNYPRGRDICLMARREGIAVVAGGVHLSCHGPSVDFLISCGVSVAIGEAEPFFDEIIDDAAADQLKPLYRIGADVGISTKTSASHIRVPDLDHLPFPAIPRSYLKRFLRRQVHVDSSRGCPFLCTFCAVKNAFGRTVRSRDPERLVAWMAEHVRNGIRSFDFTDDNFTRSPRHLEVLERLARLREDGLEFSVKMMLDIEATCYVHEHSARGTSTRSFLDLCRRAGVRHVYIGLETTSDEALNEIKKNVNRPRHTAANETNDRLIERFRTGIQAWHAIGATTRSAIMVGLESDTRESAIKGARDAAAIGIDFANFAWVTPLPGADNYAQAAARNTLRHADFNAYFYEPMLRHPSLSTEDLVRMIDEGTREFYSLHKVAPRVANALLGRGRARCAEPAQYLVRQVVSMIGKIGRLFVMQQVSGGFFRRGRRYSAARLAVTNEEARACYLSDRVPRPRLVPESMLDDATMESMPILRHHDLRAFEGI